MKDFKDLSELERVFLTSYIDKFLRWFGHVPDAPEIPVTWAYFRLTREQFRVTDLDALVEPGAILRSGVFVVVPTHSEPIRDVSDLQGFFDNHAIVMGESTTGRTTMLRFIAVNLAVKLARELDLPVQWDSEPLRHFKDFEPQLPTDRLYLPIFVPLEGVEPELVEIRPSKRSAAQLIYEVEPVVLDALEKAVRSAPKDVKKFFKDRELGREILNEWPIAVFFDSIDKLREWPGNMITGINYFLDLHPNAMAVEAMERGNMIVEDHLASPDFLNLFESNRYQFYELPTLDGPEEQREFAGRWLKNLHEVHPDIQLPEPNDVVDVVGRKHTVLKNSLKNPFMFQKAVELAFFGGLDGIEKLRSRSKLYEFHIDSTFYRMLERFGALKIEGGRWKGGRFEFLYSPMHGRTQEAIESLRDTVIEALKALAEAMNEKGGKISKKEVKDISKFKAIDKLLSTFWKGTDYTPDRWPRNGIEFFRTMNVLTTTSSDMFFVRNDYLDYFLGQRVLDKWRKGSQKAWNHLRNIFVKDYPYKPLLFFAGSLRDEEIEKIVTELLDSGEENDVHQFWNLMTAAFVIGETGYRGEIRNRLISMMQDWYKSHRFWKMKPPANGDMDAVYESERFLQLIERLWGDAVAALDYPQEIIYTMVEKLDIESDDIMDMYIWAEVIETLNAVGLKDPEIIRKIIEKLDDSNSTVKAAAFQMFINLGIDDPYVIERIARELDESNVAGEAMLTLAMLKVSDPVIIRKIASKLGENVSLDSFSRSYHLDPPKAALIMLGLLYPDTVSRILMEVLDSAKGRALVDALRVIYKLKLKEPSVIQKVQEALDDENPIVQLTAMRLLADWNVKNPYVMQKAIEKLESESPYLREIAIRMLVQFGVDDPDVVRKIEARLDDENRRVRLAAIEALSVLKTQNIDAIKKLIDMFGDRDWDIQDKALSTVIKLGVKDPEIIQYLKKKMKEMRGVGRDYARTALEELEAMKE